MISSNWRCDSQARTMTDCEVKPCWTAFCDDFSFPSGVFGPWDLAPFRRAVSDLNLDGISISSAPSIPPQSSRERRSRTFLEYFRNVLLDLKYFQVA